MVLHQDEEEDNDNSDDDEEEEQQKENELLNCRLVCKHWAAGVSNYLNSLPTFNVPKNYSTLSSSHLAPGSPIWFPEDFLRCQDHDEACFTVDFTRGAEHARERMEELDRLFPDREKNPFVGGILRISKDFGNSREYYYRNNCEKFEKDVWNVLLELTKKWGKHISILIVSFDKKDMTVYWDHALLDRLRVLAWKSLLRLFRNLPNLKYFEFEGDTSCRCKTLL